MWLSWCCRAYDTGSAHFIPSVEVKMLLRIGRVASCCLLPQGVARRRYRRPLSPSGSGGRCQGPTSSRVQNSLFLPLYLGEIRGIAPSLLFTKNFSVDQVLKAGMWRRLTTFTRHYLRDIAHRSLDAFHLGSVVAAQALV